MWAIAAATRLLMFSRSIWPMRASKCMSSPEVSSNVLIPSRVQIKCTPWPLKMSSLISHRLRTERVSRSSLVTAMASTPPALT
jgi:hypothetical protein